MGKQYYDYQTGAPNDGFLLNNLKTLLRLSIQSTLSYLEMHSKQSYKCSVMLGELKSFRNYQGLRVIFPKIFGWNLTYNESEIFSDS